MPGCRWSSLGSQSRLCLCWTTGTCFLDTLCIVLAELDKLLPTADICITTPFWPAYLDKERLEKAKKLELSLTAGVGSDHIDLHAAAKKGITVAEVLSIACGPSCFAVPTHQSWCSARRAKCQTAMINAVLILRRHFAIAS